MSAIQFMDCTGVLETCMHIIVHVLVPVWEFVAPHTETRVRVQVLQMHALVCTSVLGIVHTTVVPIQLFLSGLCPKTSYTIA